MNQKANQQDLDAQVFDAATSGDLARAQQLIQVGANIHANDDYALGLAALNGHVEVVRLLLAKGADIHANTEYALHQASENGHLEVAQLLLDGDADIHAGGDYALRLASRNSHADFTAFLFHQDPDYFTKLIERDRSLSKDESLLALVKHYRLGLHLQANTSSKPRIAL